MKEPTDVAIDLTGWLMDTLATALYTFGLCVGFFTGYIAKWIVKGVSEGFNVGYK
ncbi:MAG: hypothetical protein M0R74_18265 [Dehalococcoidia bacterium]|nr:hypothetical protein [Dehalococcoidia bacterium]